MPSHAFLFANGSLPDLEPARRLIDPSALLIAADGGTRHALALGLTPSVILGDLDSLPADMSPRLEAAGVRFLRYPADKDETDLELALEFALRQGCTRITVLSPLRGRLDRTLANLALLTDPRLEALDVRLDDGLEEAFFVRCGAEIHGQPGDLVSLLPWGGPVTGIRTDGLRWPLVGESLSPHKTRGISNEMTAASARVEIESGLLLLIHRRSFPPPCLPAP